MCGKWDLLPANERLFGFNTTNDTDYWFLVSPGPNQKYFDRRTSDNIVIEKIDIISHPPFVNGLKEKVHQDLLTIGHAIEQFQDDTGLLLIDGWDDDTVVGRSRLSNEFENIGNVAENNRVTSHIL